MGICCITGILLLVLQQVRASVAELRALRAHLAATEVLADDPPADDHHAPAVPTADRHGMHVLPTDDGPTALRATLTAVSRPDRRMRPADIVSLTAFLTAGPPLMVRGIG